MGLEVLQKMNLSRAEAGENLLKDLSFDTSKGEAERGHRSANATLEKIHQLQSDIAFSSSKEHILTRSLTASFFREV